MQNWHDNGLRLIAEIDRCIRAREGETRKCCFVSGLERILYKAALLFFWIKTGKYRYNKIAQ